MIARGYGAAFLTRRLVVLMLVSFSIVSLYSAVAYNRSTPANTSKVVVSAGSGGGASSPLKQPVSPPNAGPFDGMEAGGVSPKVRVPSGSEDAGTRDNPRNVPEPPPVDSTERAEPDQQPDAADNKSTAPAAPPVNLAPTSPGTSGVPVSVAEGSVNTDANQGTANSLPMALGLFSLTPRSPATTGNRDNVIRQISGNKVAFDFGGLQPNSKYIWQDIFAVNNLTTDQLDVTVTSSGAAKLWFSTDSGKRWSLERTGTTPVKASSQIQISVQVEVPADSAITSITANVSVSATQKGGGSQ